MAPFIKTAGGFLKAIGSTDMTFAASPNSMVARFKGKFKDSHYVARVQEKAEWGTDLATNIGTNWKDGRLPYKSVQFLMPTPQEGDVAYTHFLLVSGDCNRIVLTPKAVIEAASKGWMKHRGVMVQSAAVENWTPRLSFFRRGENGWEKDTDNLWTAPVKVSMDPDEFLKSLR